MALSMVLTMLLVAVGMATAMQNGNEYANNQEDGPLRDGSCQDTVVTTDLLYLHNGPQFGGYDGVCPCDSIVVTDVMTVEGAPNSGDGIPDGSGWDEENPRPGEVNGEGPAPNSGDGIPDGSGF